MADLLQQLLLDEFRESVAPVIPASPRVRRLRLGGVAAPSVSVGPGGEALVLPGPEVPQSSYQWLLFETFSGSEPAGGATFERFGPPIPFLGAITEVDVVSSDPGATWQMRLDVEGVGPIFRTSQSLAVLEGEGWFRPTPPGFWPETEGLVVALPQPGARPRVTVRRSTDAEPPLTLRVLIVAHPAEE